MEEEPVAPEPETRTHPGKLPLRRRSTQPNQVLSTDPMREASSGTAKRMSEFMKYIPTPGFIPLRKK
ncbi:hypothetical protein PIB30_059322 [Stylosanthes scabra]|uniref:Uncharacterized protein n=1 Tax=Stylosanthes scabra TaxID=79078 RepID=A0ABU6QL66_9FABA|nr:hypothetical protein [Stylosanthes scabra]